MWFTLFDRMEREIWIATLRVVSIVCAYQFRTWFVFQIFSQQMIDQNSTKSIAHHVDGCSEAIPVVERKKKEEKFADRIKSTTQCCSCTYNNQSMLMIKLISSAGNPTVSNTITMVTSPEDTHYNRIQNELIWRNWPWKLIKYKPADGMPAAPIDAAVAVTLLKQTKDANKLRRKRAVFVNIPDGNQLCEWYGFAAQLGNENCSNL